MSKPCTPHLTKNGVEMSHVKFKLLCQDQQFDTCRVVCLCTYLGYSYDHAAYMSLDTQVKLQGAACG